MPQAHMMLFYSKLRKLRIQELCLNFTHHSLCREVQSFPHLASLIVDNIDMDACEIATCVIPHLDPWCSTRIHGVFARAEHKLLDRYKHSIVHGGTLIQVLVTSTETTYTSDIGQSSVEKLSVCSNRQEDCRILWNTCCDRSRAFGICNGQYC